MSLNIFSSGTKAKASEVNENFAKQGQEWTLVETLNFDGSTSTATTSTLTAFKQYKIVFNVTSASSAGIGLQVNGISTTSYNHLFDRSTDGLASQTGKTYWYLFKCSNTIRGIGEVLIDGVSAGAISIIGKAVGAYDEHILRHGSMTLASTTQITDFTIFCKVESLSELTGSDVNITGDVLIFGSDV